MPLDPSTSRHGHPTHRKSVERAGCEARCCAQTCCSTCSPSSRTFACTAGEHQQCRGSNNSAGGDNNRERGTNTVQGNKNRERGTTTEKGEQQQRKENKTSKRGTTTAEKGNNNNREKRRSGLTSGTTGITLARQQACKGANRCIVFAGLAGARPSSANLTCNVLP